MTPRPGVDRAIILLAHDAQTSPRNHLGVRTPSIGDVNPKARSV